MKLQLLQYPTYNIQQALLNPEWKILFAIVGPKPEVEGAYVCSYVLCSKHIWCHALYLHNAHYFVVLCWESLVDQSSVASWDC